MNLVSNSDISLKSYDKINYFKETSVSDYVSLTNKFEDIKKIISLSSNVKINSVKLCKSKKLISNEGQLLSGFILLVEYSITENLRYVGFNLSNNIFFYSFSEPSNYCYIVVPAKIDNIGIDDIINKKLYSISSYLENVEFDCIDKRKFYYHITLLINFNPLT